MRIGELAKKTGLSPSRIRFYESAGLLQAVSRQANGYRDYPLETASVLEIIDSAQRAGFSLEQIRHLLPLGNGSWDHNALLVALEAKVVEIELMQKRLRQNKAQLKLAIESITNRPADMGCTENKRRVLGRLRGEPVVKSQRKPQDKG